MRLCYTAPLSLPQIAPDALDLALEASVLVELPGEERRLLRYAPEFIDDPAGTGLFAGLAAATYVSPLTSRRSACNPCSRKPTSSRPRC